MKGALILPLLLDVCAAICLVLLISSVPSCSNTTDASEDTIEDDEIQTEDVEIESTGGTWTDPSSGLTWQNPPAESEMTWQDALDYCESSTRDSHADWHLPTISELRSLMRGCPDTQTGGSCGVVDECLSGACSSDKCYGCSGDEGPDGGCYWPVEAEGPCSWYWSSSSREGGDDSAWHINFGYGGIASPNQGHSSYVRCVR